jgi:hypothetical protein
MAGWKGVRKDFNNLNYGISHLKPQVFTPKEGASRQVLRKTGCGSFTSWVCVKRRPSLWTCAPKIGVETDIGT